MRRTIIFVTAICLCYGLFHDANAQTRKRQPRPRPKTSQPKKPTEEASQPQKNTAETTQPQNPKAETSQPIMSQVPRPTPQDLSRELLSAISKNNIAQVRSLLEKGADFNTKDSNGLTVLIIAALYGYTDIVQSLIAKGANVNVECPGSGLTPLMLAAIMGHSDVIDILLDKGANVNAEVNGITAYLFAVIGRPNIVKDQKAIAEKLYTRESAAGNVAKQKAAAMFAIERCHWAGYEGASLARSEMINLFGATFGIARSVDVTIYNLGIKDMWTAVGKGDIAVLQTLLADGANVNEISSCGNTPLIIAAEFGQVDVIQFLLGKGADINVQGGQQKWNALMTAVNFNKVEAVRLLLSSGADLNLKAIDGRSALSIAGGRIEIVKLLKEAGAR